MLRPCPLRAPEGVASGTFTGRSGRTGEGILAFGSFELHTSERLLLRDGERIELGGRALDLLITLATSAPEVIGKRELLARVWPDTLVEEGSLRFQMAALRRALCDGRDGARYIVTLPGRGYCFVASIAGKSEPAPPGRTTTTLLPSAIQVIGRDDDVRAIAEQLLRSRFVTVVGAGGVGKTTTSVRVGHQLLDAFDRAAFFVDLGPVADPALVPVAVASMLDVPVLSSDPVAALVAHLERRRLLLILDSCEHVVGAAAALAETIFAQAQQVHILVTSRETLRAAGETVYPLAPLATPSPETVPTAEEALGFSAVQLFVERARASDPAFALTDDEAPVVADICRRLDGMALAIELAASRVHAYGVRHTALLLNGQLELRWQGRRTALPRHQTLNATLDWSYDLLPETERTALRRLAVLAGRFDVEAARAVAGHDDPDGAACLEALVGLVNKSLVSVGRSGERTLYRLLDTTRAYARAKLNESGESSRVAHVHAEHFQRVLCDTYPAFWTAEARRLYADHVANVRAALAWCFGPAGDCELGVRVAATATPLFLQLSLLTECRRWTEQALACLDEAARGTKRELVLQAALGQALMFTAANSEEARAAFLRGLELAEQLGDLPLQLQLLGNLHIFHERTGDFHAALGFAERSLEIAEALGDEGGIAAAHSFLGISCHLMGRHEAAHAHLVAGLNDAAIGAPIHFGFDHRNRAQIALARNLFMRGFAEQAAAMAETAVAQAAEMQHPVTLCIALIWSVNIEIWTGRLGHAEEQIERFVEHAERHSLGPYLAVGAGVQGELALRRGDTEAGIKAVRSAFDALHADRYELLSTAFLATIAEGLAAVAQFDEALTTADEAIALVERQGDLCLLPDLLRSRAQILASLSNTAPAEAELHRALDMSRAHGALAWELRAATSLARLWARGGKAGEARTLLQSVYDRFTEGFETDDLQQARNLLEQLPGAEAALTRRSR